MAIIRKIDIGGIQNVERYISTEVFEKVGKCNLEKVEFQNNELTLYFSDEENIQARNFVKQLSKKKYRDLSRYFSKAPRNWRLMKIVETKKLYLLFFSESAR